MMGMVMSNQSLRSRLTRATAAKISCSATAPTKGGMISGSTPSVCINSAPRNSKHRQVGQRQRDDAGKRCHGQCHPQAVEEDSRNTSWSKKLPKWPTVSAPVSVTKAV